MSAKGAGPGYGLLSPFGEAQRVLCRGEFSFADGEQATSAPGGVLAVASGGCGSMWLLVLRGRGRGEVWVHGLGSDGKVRRVAGSFSEWYRAWLDAAVSETGPFCQWDAGQCATPNLLSNVLLSLEKDGLTGDAAAARIATMVMPGAISLEGGESPYLPSGAPLDPCQSCVALAGRFGLRSEVFKPGVAPLQADESIATGRSGGFLSRLASLFKSEN